MAIAVVDLDVSNFPVQYFFRGITKLKLSSTSSKGWKQTFRDTMRSLGEPFANNLCTRRRDSENQHLP